MQYSEDSETGEGQRKRFRLSRDDEEMEAAGAKVKKKKKKKKKSWADQEPSASHSLEVGGSDVRLFDSLSGILCPETWMCFW